MNKKHNFNPSDIGIDNGNIYGLPFTYEQAQVVVIPVPWDVTASYGGGSADGPKSILKESLQIDLYDPEIKDAWELGVFLKPISQKVCAKNRLLRKKAEKYIAYLAKGGDKNDKKSRLFRGEINKECGFLNEFVRAESDTILNDGKTACVLGGDHSTPLGLIQALARCNNFFSILHLDAHADLRKAYEGFDYSHASIMYNASKIKNIDQMVLVGVRDYCEEEASRIKKSRGRIIMFDNRLIKKDLFCGGNWDSICNRIIKPLSKKVYVSFDIDALVPSLCPNTGTPVPSGLEYEQALYLIAKLVKSGRRIIGLDLSEVSPAKNNRWDAVVGAQLFYRLLNLAGVSNSKLKLAEIP